MAQTWREDRERYLAGADDAPLRPVAARTGVGLKATFARMAHSVFRIGKSKESR